MQSFSQVALLVDVENTAAATLAALDKLMPEISQLGPCVLRRAYADWSGYTKYKPILLEQGFELIEVPHYSQRGKNACDIRMALDALEMVFEQPFIETLVICSHDSDFIPLFVKLQNYRKQVIVLGERQYIHNLLIKFAQGFIDVTPFLPPPAVEDAPAKSEGAAYQPAPQALKSFALLERAVTELGAGSQAVLISLVKSMMQRINPAFSEKRHGYSRFLTFLKDLEKVGRLQLYTDAENATYLTLLPPADAQTADSPTPFPSAEQQAFELLQAAVGDLQYQNIPADISRVKSRMLQLQPDFQEKQLGYKQFSDFVNALASRGWLRVKTVKGGNSRIELPLAAAEARSPVPHSPELPTQSQESAQIRWQRELKQRKFSVLNNVDREPLLKLLYQGLWQYYSTPLSKHELRTLLYHHLSEQAGELTPSKTVLSNLLNLFIQTQAIVTQQLSGTAAVYYISAELSEADFIRHYELSVWAFARYYGVESAWLQTHLQLAEPPGKEAAPELERLTKYLFDASTLSSAAQVQPLPESLALADSAPPGHQVRQALDTYKLW